MRGFVSENFLKACIETSILYNNTVGKYYSELHPGSVKEWSIIFSLGLIYGLGITETMVKVSRNSKCRTSEGRFKNG